MNYSMLPRKITLPGILALSLAISGQIAFAGDNVFSVPESSLVPQGSWITAPKYTPPQVISGANSTSSSNSTNLGGSGIFSFGSPAMTPVLPPPYVGGGNYWGTGIGQGIGLGIGGFSSTMNMGTPYYGSGMGYGSWGHSPGFGSYPGWGSGLGYSGYSGYRGYGTPWYSPGGYAMNRMHSSNQQLGTLSGSTVIQTAPSKASGNYYGPGSTDSSASGSYYASDTPSYVPAPKPYSTGDNFWGGGSGSGTSSNSNPFPKDLNKTPW